MSSALATELRNNPGSREKIGDQTKKATQAVTDLLSYAWKFVDEEDQKLFSDLASHLRVKHNLKQVASVQIAQEQLLTALFLMVVSMEIVQGNVNAMKIVNCNDEAMSYCIKRYEPNSNTKIYIPMDTDLRDH